jgi:hypothetical protein
MRLLGICAASVVALLAGCATPPEVKQAVVSLDTGYNDNLKLMQQYRELVIQINERERTWKEYLDARALLASALTWATTDPPSNYDPDVHAELLGPALVSIVNCVRLHDLPERRGKKDVVFAASGKECRDKAFTAQLGDRCGKLTGIIQALPRIVIEVNKRADERSKRQGDLAKVTGLQGFDDYRTNVQALKAVNSTIQRYLEIDVTVKPDDINEIAASIRQLR